MKQIYRPSSEELERDIKILKFTHVETYRCGVCNKRTILLTEEKPETTPMCDCGVEPQQWGINLAGITLGDVMRALKYENKGSLSEEFLYQLEMAIMGIWYRKTQLNKEEKA